MRRSDEPLTKVTVNIFTADLEWLRERYGWGWSEELRKVIRAARRREQLEEIEDE